MRRGTLPDFVVEQLGDPDGIGGVDETSFVKKGMYPAGVQCQ